MSPGGEGAVCAPCLLPFEPNDANTACVQPPPSGCPPGQGLEAGRCVDCGASDTVSPGGEGAVCTPCAAPLAPSSDNTECLPPAPPIACPPGYGLEGNRCVDCGDRDMVSPGGEGAVCAPCAAPLEPNDNSTACVPPPPEGCPPGEGLAAMGGGDGGSGAVACVACNATGQVSAGGPRALCEDCAPGLVADAAGVACAPLPSDPAELRARMLELHAARRARHGAAPLAWNETLEAAAAEFASKCSARHNASELDARWEGENM